MLIGLLHAVIVVSDSMSDIKTVFYSYMMKHPERMKYRQKTTVKLRTDGRI